MNVRSAMIVIAEKAAAKIIHIGTGIENPEKYSPTQVKGPIYIDTQNGHFKSFEQRSIDLSFLKTPHGPKHRVIKTVTR